MTFKKKAIGKRLIIINKSDQIVFKLSEIKI